MSATQLIIIIALATGVVAALAATRSGARITQITRTVKRDERKDRDDA